MSDWESYWRKIKKTGEGGQVFWDSEADQASMLDLDRFRAHMDFELPLVDLGCGNGRQSRFLAQQFKTVVGLDVSESAIRLAQSETSPGANVSFRVFDATDTNAARELHDHLGDANIYMRGVLHMIKWNERPAFIESLRVLLGDHGLLYQIELTSESILGLRSLPDGVFEQIPKVTRRVGFNSEDRARFFPDDAWQIIEAGEGVWLRSVTLPDGSRVDMPGTYLIMKPV